MQLQAVLHNMAPIPLRYSQTAKEKINTEMVLKCPIQHLNLETGKIGRTPTRTSADPTSYVKDIVKTE